MALNPDSVGKTTSEIVHTYGFRDVIRYALGVGARRDADLKFLYEGLGPLVLPTYAVVPSFEALEPLLDVVGGDMLGVVHGAQSITLHQPFEPSGKLRTIGKVAGIYDLRRMAQGVLSTETRDEQGALICEAEMQIIFRLDGGFGGERPPPTERVRAPSRSPDFEVSEPTSPEQALLYRLSGDLNPLHADPEIATKAGFDAPILHGLCTFGFVGRAVLEQCCAGDPSRLKSLNGQFRKPVWPGDTIITRGWNEGDRIVIQATTKERPDEFPFSNAYAVVT